MQLKGLISDLLIHNSSHCFTRRRFSLSLFLFNFSLCLCLPLHFCKRSHSAVRFGSKAGRTYIVVCFMLEILWREASGGEKKNEHKAGMFFFKELSRSWVRDERTQKKHRERRCLISFKVASGRVTARDWSYSAASEQQFIRHRAACDRRKTKRIFCERILTGSSKIIRCVYRSSVYVRKEW